jgi:hypothetical protein
MAQPELFKTLQKEVDEAETIDYDNFKDLTQTLATFNEGMRLHPSVPKVRPTSRPLHPHTDETVVHRTSRLP